MPESDQPDVPIGIPEHLRPFVRPGETFSPGPMGLVELERRYQESRWARGWIHEPGGRPDWVGSRQERASLRDLDQARPSLLDRVADLWRSGLGREGGRLHQPSQERGLLDDVRQAYAEHDPPRAGMEDAILRRIEDRGMSERSEDAGDPGAPDGPRARPVSNTRSETGSTHEVQTGVAKRQWFGWVCPYCTRADAHVHAPDDPSVVAVRAAVQYGATTHLLKSELTTFCGRDLQFDVRLLVTTLLEHADCRECRKAAGLAPARQEFAEDPARFAGRRTAARLDEDPWREAAEAELGRRARERRLTEQGLRGELGMPDVDAVLCPRCSHDINMHRRSVADRATTCCECRLTPRGVVALVRSPSDTRPDRPQVKTLTPEEVGWKLTLEDPKDDSEPSEPSEPARMEDLVADEDRQGIAQERPAPTKQVWRNSQGVWHLRGRWSWLTACGLEPQYYEAEVEGRRPSLVQTTRCPQCEVLADRWFEDLGRPTIDEVAEALMDTDVLTPNEDGAPTYYLVDAENVEHLVKTVLELAEAHVYRER